MQNLINNLNQLENLNNKQNQLENLNSNLNQQENPNKADRDGNLKKDKEKMDVKKR